MHDDCLCSGIHSFITFVCIPNACSKISFWIDLLRFNNPKPGINIIKKLISFFGFQKIDPSTSKSCGSMDAV